MDSSTFHTIAADFLVVIHFLAIGFIVFGGLLLWRWPIVAFLHLPLAAWGVIMEFNGWICPLTPWEQELREAAGEVAYRGGFVENYLVPLIYPAQLTREIQVLLGLFVLVLNVAVYGWWLKSRRKRARDE